MFPRNSVVLFVVTVVACTPEGGQWRSAPVALSPTPVILRPSPPLNPGRVSAELCVGLPPALLALPSGVPHREDDPAGGVRLASGETLRIHVVLRSATGAVWVDSTTRFVDAGTGPFKLCTFGAIPAAFREASERPRFTTVELSATVPVRVNYVSWQAAAFGSL